MGFASVDDYVAEVTAGKFWRTDFNKQTLAAGWPATIGRWYDLSTQPGSPVAIGGTPLTVGSGYGEMIWNGIFLGGSNYWTLTAGWTWSANTLVKSGDGTTALTATMQKAFVAGRSYRVTYTLSAWSVGTCTVSCGGTAGTARGSAATFTETLVATNANALTFVGTNTSRFTIASVSVIEALQSFTLDDTLQGAFYHGGNVAGDTKHLINAGVVSAAATFVPGAWMLVDLLMCYPGINMASASLQTLLNANSLPRYTDGKGVRAALVITLASGGTAHNLAYSYTNTVPTSGRTNPVTVACTASAIYSHITHAGVAANNYGPALPLQAGDVGLTKVDTLQLSASSTAGEAAMVLYKPLMWLPMTTASVAAERDFMNQLPSLPRIYDGACLGLFFFAGAALAASSNVYGYLDFAWG